MTPDEDFKLASDLDAIINFDDITHRTITIRSASGKKPCPAASIQAAILYFENEIMDTPQEAKYGMTREQLIEAFKYMKAKGVKHFRHPCVSGLNTVANEYYPALAHASCSSWRSRSRKRKTGVHIAFINLSGGVGYPPISRGRSRTISWPSARGVRRAYEEVLAPAGMDDIEVYTEIGPLYSPDLYGALVARCIHHKQTYHEYAGLDACAANLMRPAMYGAYHHITILGKEDAARPHL